MILGSGVFKVHLNLNVLKQLLLKTGWLTYVNLCNKLFMPVTQLIPVAHIYHAVIWSQFKTFIHIKSALICFIVYTERCSTRTMYIYVWNDVYRKWWHVNELCVIHSIVTYQTWVLFETSKDGCCGLWIVKFGRSWDTNTKPGPAIMHLSIYWMPRYVWSSSICTA